MYKRVVITGGAGFIGSHTADEFISNGYEVVVIDNLRTGSLENIAHLEANPNFTFFKGDICDIEVLNKNIKEGDVVVHLAAMISTPETITDPIGAHDINITGANNVYVASKNAKVKKIISASSAAIYGNYAPVPTSETFPNDPLSPYALHKSINEQYGKVYSEIYNTPFVFPRFFNVYGPRQKAEGGYASVIPFFIKKAQNGEVPTINGSLEISRDFVFVKDVARALRLCAEKDMLSMFEIVNIATGTPTTLGNLWEIICNIKNINIKPNIGPHREADIDVSLADVSKAKTLIGFTAEKSFADGMKETVEQWPCVC